MNTDDPTTETSTGHATVDHAPVPHYEIRVGGRLGGRWASWFDGMSLTGHDDGTTVIAGPVVDQTALHGLLQRLRDLGIPLVSLTQLDPEPCPERPSGRPHPDAQESSP